jgi:hypothetical protein
MEDKGGELTRSTFSFLRSSSDADEAAAMVARGGSDTAVCLGRLGFATTMQERASERARLLRLAPSCSSGGLVQSERVVVG